MLVERLGVLKSEFDGERGRSGMGAIRFVLELHGRIGRIEGAEVDGLEVSWPGLMVRWSCPMIRNGRLTPRSRSSSLRLVSNLVFPFPSFPEMY